MKCSKCKDMGFIPTKNEETGEIEGLPCSCRIEYDKNIVDTRFRGKLLSAGITKFYWDISFDSYLKLISGNKNIYNENKKVIDILIKYIDNCEYYLNNYSTLWLWGKEGNIGCTSLALILAKELIKKDYEVKFTTMQNLLNAFTEFEDKKNYFSDLNRSDIFVLDDVFVKNKCSIRGDYTAVQLYNWLNNSILESKNFICTSNVDYNRIDKIYENNMNIFKKSILSVELQGTLPSVPGGLS